jgi:hypothetical protein
MLGFHVFTLTYSSALYNLFITGIWQLRQFCSVPSVPTSTLRGTTCEAVLFTVVNADTAQPWTLFVIIYNKLFFITLRGVVRNFSLVRKTEVYIYFCLFRKREHFLDTNTKSKRQ